MTKEEAAIIIHKLKQDVLTGAVRRYEPLEGEVLLSAEFYDVINMAIENLEQEPCTDAISRQAVAEVLLKYAHSTEGKAFAEFLISQINALPSIKPQYTDAEIQKMQDLEFAEIQKAYEIGKEEGSEVLDKIREEIMDINVARDEYSQRQNDYCDGVEFAKRYFLQIIDKYKASPTGAESEVQDADNN